MGRGEGVMVEIRKNKNDINILNLDGDFSELDKANMIKLLEEFPQKMRDALRLGEEFSIPTNFLPAPDSTRSFQNIVVLGMGGSAIGGDLLSDYLADELSIPIVVIRGYDISKFIDENSGRDSASSGYFLSILSSVKSIREDRFNKEKRWRDRRDAQNIAGTFQ